MGYYSDVAIAMRKKDLQQMLDEARNLPDDNNWTYDFIQEGIANAPIWEDEDYALITWADIKWYDTKGEVSFIKDFLNHIEDEHYDYLRIGEDYDDVEYHFETGEYLLQYERSIGFGRSF